MKTRSIVLFLILTSMANAATELTADVAGKATSYMEWMLDVPFTDAQGQRYQRILAETFRGGNKGAVDGIVSMARAVDRIQAMSEGERNALRDKVQAEFVKLLKQANDADSRWMLSIYETAHPPALKPVGNTPLTGNWKNSHVSSIQYKNSYTGVHAPTSGSHFSYDFFLDGTYSYTGLLQSTMYNCTTATFAHETGTYRVEGNSVSLKPEKNPYQMTNSCAHSSDHESPGKLIDRTFRFRIGEENGSKKLELVDGNGAIQNFYRPK